MGTTAMKGVPDPSQTQGPAFGWPGLGGTGNQNPGPWGNHGLGAGWGANDQAKKEPPKEPPSVDHSDALIVASDNAKQTALAQIMGQQFALQQASLDRELALAANLEKNLEKFDTDLQIAKLGFIQNMTAEENRHVEKMAADASRHSHMTASSVETTPDLPPPPEEIGSRMKDWE